MNRTSCLKHAMRLALGLAVLALAATPSFAATYDLCATTGSVTMPDSTVVPIWGYIIGDCTTGGGTATIPGPVLEVPSGDTNLTVTLYNELPDPVSIFIPGLAKPVTPVTVTDGQGRERLRSLDVEVFTGGSQSYSWTVTEGTYLYHSGTFLRTQVPMGLYGALVVNGTEYPAASQEEVLVYSEIDPQINLDNAAGVPFADGARVTNWFPQYFLINGKAGSEPADINVDISTDVLLRFVNAGLDSVIPTLGGGLYMDVFAEDGNLYQDQNGNPVTTRQYGLELTAAKTFDALINAGSVGNYPLYDRAGNGGTVATIVASAATGAPTAVDDPTVPADYTIAEDSAGLTTVAGGSPPGVLDNDTGGAAAAVLVSGPSYGVLSGGLAANGSFTYVPNADFNGTDSFTYVANDGAGGPDSNVATATITVTPVNDAPVAVPDFYDAVEGTTLTVAAPGVLANDNDVDGDTLTATQTGIAPPGVLLFNADGSFDYTPAGTAGASETFDYDACDPSLACSTTTVTITVVGPPANIPPIANDDTAEVERGSLGNVINLTDNDEDSDGNIVPSTVFITTGLVTQRGGSVISNGDGTVTYDTPNTGWTGTDTFQYTVDDNDGATSNVATVRVNVVKP